MKHSKIYISLIVSGLIYSLSQPAAAQTEHELRQKALKENTEQLNRVYQNNLPNARGSSVRDLSGEIRAAREAAEKEEKEIAKKQAEYEKSMQDYAEYLVTNKLQHEARVEAIRKQQQPFLTYLGKELPNINIYDKADWYTDHLFVMIEGPKVAKLNYKEVKELDYAGASTALSTFDAVKTTAPYDALITLLDEGKLLFHSTRTRLAYLYQRFPEQTQATEIFELNLLPQYYGANRPFLMPAKEIEFSDAPMYYPPTCFETGSRIENKEVTERFVSLTNKYPAEGLAAAKNARGHLNPFFSYVQLLDSDNEAPDKILALKNENYWRAIHTYNSSAHLVEAFNWLNTQKNMYTKLKELSPEEWLQMGNGIYTLSNLRATFMIKGLLGGAAVPYYDFLFNKYKNIKKAVSIKDKQIDEENKAQKKLERQKKQGRIAEKSN